MKPVPFVDKVRAEMPGRSEPVIVEIGHIGHDRDGVQCVFFEVDGVIGCEAVEDLDGYETDAGVIWSVKGTSPGGTWEQSSRQKLELAKDARRRGVPYPRKNRLSDLLANYKY